MNTQHYQNEYSTLLDQPQTQNQPIYVEPTSSSYGNEEITSIFLFILGFFVCITWPICFFMYRKSDNQLARVMAIISLILTITSIAVYFILAASCIIIYAVVFIIIAVAGEDDDYYYSNALKNIFQR
ncbi:Transmembrane protein [Entamoeba marina]